MIGWLLGLINPLGMIVSKIGDVQMRLAAEANDAARVALEGELGVLNARKDVILAVRIGFAVPFFLYIWKLVLWDKPLGWGVTDGLSSDLWAILYIVLGGYFVDTVVRRFKA